MGPYETIRDYMVAYQTIWYHTVPTELYGTIQCHTVPNSAVPDHAAPYWIIKDYTGPCGSIGGHMDHKGRLPKNPYKLGIMDQPKVGRCPEGV